MEEQEKNIQKKPVKCPLCNSQEISSTVIQHRATICRFFKFTCLIIMFLVFALNISTFIEVSEESAAVQTITLSIDSILPTATNEPAGIVKNEAEISVIAFIVLAVIAVLLEIAQQYLESKSKIQNICKHCGHSWSAEY